MKGAACRANCYVFRVSSRRSFQKISDGLFDAVALVGIGDEVGVGGAMLEDAAFQDFRFGPLLVREQLPVLASGKVGLDSSGRSPIEVAVRIRAVSELRGHRNDALVRIVGRATN